uniref:Uncharacterized protein n=1 Tax=Phaeomonas parva TaxID=124430 RepID=A0A7S1XW95_9STRA|mmetsp:Transcript_43350/g.135785  ORF Transcript_43350/g.135785 Transcript_43350/m.135785 type:complete len:410 (+) Transcript_43350:163-1392(+)
MAAFSGRAGEIRACMETEQVDLGGVTPAQVPQLVADAFGTPRDDLTEMIRVSLVVGAGKLGRQKYHADLPKALVAALREHGYEEDTGAALLWDCAGSFKHQHDTGKNLKILHVYPLATPPGADEDEADAGPQWTPQQILCICNMERFEDAVRHRTPTWQTRRQLVDVLKAEGASIAAMEQKMCTGTPLEPDEQAFYDEVSTELLEQKAAYLQTALRDMVQAGQIDTRDKAAALAAATERLRELQGVENPNPKVLKQIEKTSERIAHLETIRPIEVPLQHHAEIVEIWKRLQELEPLQKKEQSGNLSLNEIRQLAERDELREQVAMLQNRSRAWFEEEDSFEARKTELRSKFVAAQRKKRSAAQARAAKKEGVGLGAHLGGAGGRAQSGPRKGQGCGRAQQVRGAGPRLG